MSTEMIEMVTTVALGFVGVIGTLVYFGVNFGGRLGKLEGSVESIDKRMTRLETAYDSLSFNVAKLMGQNVAFGNSPRVLSPAGVKLLEEIKGEELVRKNYTELKSAATVEGISKLDIQEGAIKAVQKLYVSGQLNDVEDMIFDSGKTLVDVYEALGLTLRDMVFSEMGYPIPGKKL